MIDIVLYEVYKEEQKAIEKFLSKKIRAKYFWQTIQSLKHTDPPARLISIRTQSQISLSWSGKLSGILSRSQGFDHILKYQQQTGIAVPAGYLGDYCSRSVAEHAVMAMMVLMRKLKRQIRNFDTFNRDNITGGEFLNKNALVVGVGNIGSHLVDLLAGLGMNVRGVDIVKRRKNLQYLPLKKGIAKADVIFCALPLTEKTNELLDYSLLRNIKKGAIFINVSRGEISPLADLKRLFDENILGGLSLDVYQDEAEVSGYLRRRSAKKGPSVKAVLDLKKRDNVLFTPHNAFNTKEALERKAFLTAEAIHSFLGKGQFPYSVSF